MECGNVVSRRRFLRGAVAGSAFVLVSRHVLGGPGVSPPSEKLNIAGVGIGGVGKAYISSVASENIAALCDVDAEYSAPVFGEYPKAKIYNDYRVMLDKQKDIDAVVIGTPDHTHAVIAVEAMRRGKHVYCAKPLTRRVYESRVLTEEARKAGVATQMSTQMNASEDHRLLEEWIGDGAIGDVSEVHIWSNRPIWPQGIDRPKDKPATPEGLDWDLWLGPAPWRPYHPAYVPSNWRGWWDFGTGALGDMGCHGFDPIVKALKLGAPTSVQASSTAVNKETYPSGSIVHYDFGARGERCAVQVTWYDGGLMPRRPAELEEGRKMSDGNGGILFVGSEGKILCGGVGNSPRLIPEMRMKEYVKPDKTLWRSPGHYKEWIIACKGGRPAAVNFDYGGPLTETVLLGNLAIRTKKKLYWDAENMKIVNDSEANALLRAPYREGWKL